MADRNVGAAPDLRALERRHDLTIAELAVVAESVPCSCWLLEAGDQHPCVSCRSRDYCRELRGFQ